MLRFEPRQNYRVECVNIASGIEPPFWSLSGAARIGLAVTALLQWSLGIARAGGRMQCTVRVRQDLRAYGCATVGTIGMMARNGVADEVGKAPERQQPPAQLGMVSPKTIALDIDELPIVARTTTCYC